MKRILIAAAVVAVTGAGSAHAADLGGARAPYIKAPMMAAPVSTWQGLYIGGNVGYGWGNGNTDFSFLPDPVTFGFRNITLNPKPEGVLGGAQIGYNWQIGSLVTGLEADIQGSGIKSDAKGGPLQHSFDSLFAIGSSSISSEKLSWFGTLRGRLGVTATPDLLLYATGGLAYGQVDASANIHFTDPVDYPASARITKAGWVAGAGAEWMFAHGWSAKLEYLYMDLGKISAIGVQIPADPTLSVGYTWHTQENIVRAGVNYHF